MLIDKVIKETMKLIHLQQTIIGWTLVLCLHSHSAASVAVVGAAGAAAEAEAGGHGGSWKVGALLH